MLQREYVHVQLVFITLSIYFSTLLRYTI